MRGVIFALAISATESKGRAVTFTFHEASCVIVGTFNIYIFRPEWLGKVGLLPKKSEVKIEVLLSHPGFRLTSPALGARWTVQPDRITLQADDPNKDCGGTVDRILECLPWTPLKGLGCNFSYRGDRESIENWDAKTCFPPAQAAESDDLRQRTWHVSIASGNQVFNLQLAETNEGLELGANVHTDLTDKSVDFAREAAKGYLSHRRKSLSLMRELFKARIENGFNDE